MKALICSIVFLFCGCIAKYSSFSSYPPPPPPPPNILPDTPPPRYIPQLKNIQVNTIPHPFNINGRMPFAVWVDGEQLPINSKESNAIVQALNIKFVEPKSTAEIHRGEGWLYPKKINAQ
jgi:hypothetical protein